MTAQLFDFPAVQPMPTIKKAKPKPKAYTGEFLAFWDLYPPRFNSSKFLAFKAWEKLDPEEQIQAMIAAPVYARSVRGKNQEYTKHAASWINGKYFETIAAPATVPSPQQCTPVDWPAIMKLYRITSNWRQENGPPPRQLGCRIPQEFLLDHEK